MHKWNSENGGLWLFTVDEYNKLPDGIELECIDGDILTKGIDNIDLDTRFGHIAFGVRNPLHHPEAELFTVFGLVND